MLKLLINDNFEKTEKMNIINTKQEANRINLKLIKKQVLKFKNYSQK